MIYEFYWSGQQVEDHEYQFIKIESSSIGATEPEVIKKLLDEYRGLVKDYSIDGWCSFLEGKGYKVEKIDYDYALGF